MKYWFIKNLDNGNYLGVDEDCEHVFGDCMVEEKEHPKHGKYVSNMSMFVVMFPTKEYAEAFAKTVLGHHEVVEKMVAGDCKINSIYGNYLNFNAIEKHSALVLFRFIYNHQ